jgi:PhzF family phenazine biosynthesis protein
MLDKWKTKTEAGKIESLYQVDSFTEKVFAGNPAGVCILSGPVDESLMRNIAAEMNLSETAFFFNDGDIYQLRWFTPTTEVDLCGHATLASAHTIWETGLLNRNDTIKFHTRSGLLLANFTDGMVEIDLPAIETQKIEPPESLLEILGISAKFIGRGSQHYLVQAASEQEVRQCRPDFTALLRDVDLPVIVTAESSRPEFDIVSRFFAPTLGINEDPVTGFAHACLGPFWRERLGREVIRAYQASYRGGFIRVTPLRDRVLLAGFATTVFQITVSAEIDNP